MIKTKKVLVLHIKRSGFQKKHTRWENYKIYFLNFWFYDIVASDLDKKGNVIVKKIKNKEKIDEVIKIIKESGFDAVFCESAEAFLIQFVMIKKKLKLPPFMIGDFDRLERANTFCQWVEKIYNENPFDMIVENPSNFWFYSVSSDIEIYYRVGIDKKRLFYTPSSLYCHDEFLADKKGYAKSMKINLKHPLIKSVKDKIVACGNNNRDYETLIKSVRGLSFDFHIFCNLQRYKFGNIPKNVHIHSPVSLKLFYQVLSVSNFVVLPLHKINRSPGIATAGIVIGLGKPIIVTDVESIRDYVIDGYNGILVKPYDEQEMKKAILFLYENKNEIERMGKNSLALNKKLDKIFVKNSMRLFKQATK